MGHEHQGKYLLDEEKLTIAAGVGCCPGGSQFVLSFSAWRPLNKTIKVHQNKGIIDFIAFYRKFILPFCCIFWMLVPIFCASLWNSVSLALELFW